MEVTRNMDARRAAQMDSWARSPGGSSRRRSSEPPEHEALRKVAHMYRSGMPNPLRLEDFSYRLSAKEALELLDLVQRSFAGGVTGDDIPRKNQLLEKACGATPGAIAQWNESMTHLNGHWVRNADVEALREAEAEFKAAEGRVIAARSKLPPDMWGPQL